MACNQQLANFASSAQRRYGTTCHKCEFVLEIIRSFVVAIRVFFRSRSDTALEVLDLRQQLDGLKAAKANAELLEPSFHDLAVQDVNVALDRRYSTVSCPFIFRCPKPQKCEHSNGKAPARSAVNSIMTGSPFGNVRPMLNASSLNP